MLLWSFQQSTGHNTCTSLVGLTQFRHTLSCKQGYNEWLKLVGNVTDVSCIMSSFLHHLEHSFIVQWFNNQKSFQLLVNIILYQTHRKILRHWCLTSGYDSILTTSIVRIMSFTLRRYSATCACPPRTAYVKAETVYWKVKQITVSSKINCFH